MFIYVQEKAQFPSNFQNFPKSHHQITLFSRREINCQTGICTPTP